MPVKNFSCQCGNRFQDLVSFTTANPTFGKCPKCGVQATEAPAHACTHRGLLNEHLMDPVERQMLLENKAMLEKMHLSGDVDTGAYKIAESGPAEFRPFNNDSFDRKKAKEEAKVIQ